MKLVHYAEGENFQEETLVKDGYTLVDFFATWCGPCQLLGPEIEKYAEEVDFKVVKVDIDMARELAIENGVRSVPTMILYKNREPIGRILGFRTKDELKAEISKLI